MLIKEHEASKVSKAKKVNDSLDELEDFCDDSVDDLPSLRQQ